MVDFEGRVVVLSLRIAQGLFAIIVLALSCYGKTAYITRRMDLTNIRTVSHWWNEFWHHNSPSQVNFFIFTSIWTILALIYLILVPWRFSATRAHHKFAILAAEAVTMIFWFAGFIAMAVFLGDRVCYGSVCSAAKAATVFGAFEW